jgi:peptidoglycan/xylan/chitin deacetylase (PgdA/CDA1 family)
MNAVRVPVLMYHRVGEAHNDWERKYCVGARRFSEHMRTLARAGWRAVSIDDFFSWLDNRTELPEQSFLLTFDDGFLGVHEHAAPVLTDLGWPATVFLVSQLIGQRDTWCEAHNPSGVTYPLMDASHIRELRGQGFSFHSHTRNHADLPTLTDQPLHDQLAGARKDLQALLGEEVPYLAYPYGHYDDRVLQATQAAGYRAAFSVQPGFNRRDIDRFRLRRLDVFGTDTPAMLLRKIKLGSNDGSLVHSARYLAGRLLARLGMNRH